jgi:hypothetical protein
MTKQLESSKDRRFATSASGSKSVSALMIIGFDHASESSDEHGNAETLDASADTFGTAVRGAGVAVRGSLARPFLLARDTGTTDGVHTRCAQTLQRIHPQCRSDNSLSH